VFLVVHNNRDQSSAFQQLHQPILFTGPYDRRRDQYVADALSDHCFRFMERCGANTNRSCGYLSPRNLCTFMALGVRACSQPVEVDLVLIGSYVLLESLQIQNQGGRRQFAQAAWLSDQFCIGSGNAVRNICFLHSIIVLQTQPS
jgi:hypothetical protein